MNLVTLTDDEILEQILEAFEEDGRLNMNYIDIEVVDSGITIGGRVSSEEELQVIDDVMGETLDLSDYNNKVWVDDTLSYEDQDDDGPSIKSMEFEDGEIDDQEYDEEDDEEDVY